MSINKQELLEALKGGLELSVEVEGSRYGMSGQENTTIFEGEPITECVLDSYDLQAITIEE